MSVRSAPFWWVVCDGCQGRIDYGEFSALVDAEQAVDIAEESEWTTHGQTHHCPDCPPLCPECGDAHTCPECAETAREDAANDAEDARREGRE